MIVKQLKSIIQNLPDNTVIKIKALDSDCKEPFYFLPEFEKLDKHLLILKVKN